MIGHSLPEKLGAERQPKGCRSELTFARIDGRKDHPKETGTPAIGKPVGSVGF
jgi:hypothetical protein